MYSIKGANICILCEKSGKIIEKIAVKTNRITIGSYPLNNIRLHTVNAERLHCKIFADSSNSVSIVNYSKSNPVRVNNCSVNSRYTLHDNDKFQVAGCLFLWNFDPANIKGVPKSRKRTIQQCRRKMITLKRVRSTGDFEKHSCVIVRRSVSLMLDAYRKRRTIHSTMSGQSMCGANISSKPCIQNASENDNAHAAVCTPSAVNTTQPNLTPLVTPHTEKENIIPANMQHLITGDLMNKSHTPVSSKRRHLACHTPVSHLIDLTTPPAKSRATSTARKALSGKAAQPPRLLDVVDIVTPSPKKFNKTPISVRSTTSTPKTTLLKSAIKNSRIHEPESKKTPLSSAFVKKTPNVKSNTPRVNTPKPTPVGYKSSTGKIRNHLISTLNDKKTVSVSKTDSPVARINLEETSKRSTPNLRKRPSATTQSRSVCVTPKGELLERCNIQTLDNVVSFAKAERNAVVESPSVVPIIDVQSIIKKPNRTTQIRSAKYSDITPHESFADGMPVAAITSEENVIALQVESSISTTCSLLEDELKCLSNMPSNANSNRNSCSSIKAAHCSGSYQKTRKTMNDISSRLPGSPSRPLSRNKLIQSNMESLKDLTKDNGMIALPTITISAEEDLDKNELLVESDLNLHLLQNDTVNNTPELRNSWRYTRNRNIGSAFTSLNASQPQLDLTAEIDESLVITEDEEAVIENNELYNLECSNSHSSTREEQMITHNASMNDRKTAQIPETTTETTSNLLSRSFGAELTSLNVDTFSDYSPTNTNYGINGNAAEQEASIYTTNEFNLNISKHITSNMEKAAREVDEIPGSLTSGVPEIVDETTSDLHSQSLDEESVSSNAVNNFECSVTEQDQVQEEAAENGADDSMDNVEPISTSQTSEMPETMDETTSVLLSQSVASEERTSSVADNKPECSVRVQEQVQGDAANQESDDSMDNVEQISTSQTSEMPETIDETTSVLLPHSVASEERTSSDGENKSECSVPVQEHVQGDAANQEADDSMDNVEQISISQTSEMLDTIDETTSVLLSHSVASEERTSSDADNKSECYIPVQEQAQGDAANQEADDSMDNVEQISTSQTSEMPETIDETTSVLLPHSVACEERTSSDADNKSECYIPVQEQAQGDAANQEADESMDNVEQISTSQTSEMPETIDETTSVLLPHSVACEERTSSVVDNKSECSVPVQEHVQGDAATQKADDSMVNVEQISTSQTSEMPETIDETTSVLLSHSVASEERTSSDADNKSECYIPVQEQAQGDAANQEADESMDNVKQISTSQTSEMPDTMDETTSVLLSHSVACEERTSSDADNKSECYIPVQEQAQGGAANQEADDSMDNVEQISTSQTSEMPETIDETTSVLLSHSVASEERTSRDADNKSECYIPVQEQAQGDAANQEADDSMVNVEPISISQTSEMPDKMDETTSVLLSHSVASEERTSSDADNKSECYVPVQKQVQGDAANQEADESMDNVEQISTSQTSEMPDTMDETTSVLLSHSVACEERTSSDADNKSECYIPVQEQAQGDAANQEADDSMDNVEQISTSQTSEMPETIDETTSVLLSHSVASEERTSSDADNKSECYIPMQEQAQGDAANQEADDSMVNVEQISTSQTSEMPDTIDETTSVLISHSVASEERTSSDADNKSECYIPVHEQVQGDAANQEVDDSMDNVFHLETSKVTPSNKDIKDVEDNSWSQTSRVSEIVVSTTSNLLSQSLHEKPASSNTDNHSQCSVTQEELVQKHSSDKTMPERAGEIVQHFQNSVQSVRCENNDRKIEEISGMELKKSSTTPKVSKRRLYNKNDYLSLTPSHMLESSQTAYVAVPNEYPILLKTKKKEKKSHDVGNQIRENRPKRACRLKITNLSEEFLAGNSPASKFVEPKPEITENNDTFAANDGESSCTQNEKSETSITQNRTVDLSVAGAKKSEADLAQTLDVAAVENSRKEKEETTVSSIGRVQKKALVEESTISITPVKKGRGRKKVVEVETDSMATDGKKTQGDKPSVGRRGRGRKEVILEETSSTTSTPIKRGRGRRANETVKEVTETEKPLSDAHKIVDLHADEDDRKMENTPIGQAAELVETDSMATDDKDTQQDKPSVGRRGRGRKQVILEETSSTTSTPIKRGRGRKAVETVKEVAVSEKLLSYADKIVDLRADEDDRKMENTPIGQATELVETDSMATDDKDTQQDKPSVGRRGRGRKQVILEETSSTTSTPIKRARGRKAVETVKEVAVSEKPLSYADKIVDLRADEDDRKMENTPIGQAAELVETDSMATDDKDTQQDKPSVGRRGRGRKQVILEETSSTTSTPIKRGRGRKAVEKVKEVTETEKPLSDADKIVDLRADEDDRKMENTPIGQAAELVDSMATDDKDTQQDKLSVGRRGRGRKQLILEETSSTTSTPIKRGRGRKAVEKVKEVTETEKPLSDADKIVDLRTDKDDRKIENTPIGQAAELVETDSMATDDKNTQQDKPSVGRRGRGRKQVIIEETSSTTSTPIKRGRGRKAVETVKEMAVSEKPLSDVDKIESEDERNHIVDLREDEDNRKMENTSSGQAAKSVESDLIATDEKDIQDKPSVGKRGRGRKQVNLEETSSTTSTPIKKARGRKAVETVQEVSNEEIPRRTRAKRN